MSAPVHVLETSATLQDAALLMSRHGVRHVPVCERGALVDIVSERDLFALQRLSLKGLSTRIRAASDLPTLQRAAQDIRRFARNLLGQGVQARQLTELISHLNDVLTASSGAAARRANKASTCSARAGWRSAPKAAASRPSPPTRTTAWCS